MCASFGLDPRFADSALLEAEHEAILEGLRNWARAHDGQEIKPTGRLARNLSSLVTFQASSPKLSEGWWGFLVDGKPASFPSINARAERLRVRPSGMRGRAVVPATHWFETQKSTRTRHRFAREDGALFGMAAITQPGRTEDGTEYTCYSIVTRSAAGHLVGIHERMPLVLSPEFASEWLSTQAPEATLIDMAISSAETATEAIRVHPISGQGEASATPSALF